MSIFGSIISKIFHHGGEASPTQAATADAPVSGGPATASASTDRAAATPPVADPAPAAASATPSPSGGTVDVAAVLEALASKNPQKLDWRHSIVDMMKLLDLDSSLGARKELAKELSYSGDTNDSASMNVWLHGQVMRKLAENGGKVPDDLKG